MAAPKTPMTDDHKAALAQGREEARNVKAYLDALETHRPKRGRPRTIESIRNRLARVIAAIPDAEPIERLSLVQERIDLEAEVAAMEQATDIEAVEAHFVKVAKSYSDRKNISRAAWRELGVPVEVLERAGIPR
ncbi:MAG: hypothetical protein ACOYNI_00845 [Acidimicrobiia bacterium]